MSAPERTCVGCGRRGPQDSMVRLAVGAGGGVAVDTGVQRSGRGAYLCAVTAAACLARDRHGARLARSMRLDRGVIDYSGLLSTLQQPGPKENLPSPPR